MTPNLQNMGFAQNHHSILGEKEPCFPVNLDKVDSPWEGSAYCTPIFFDGGGDMREGNGSILFDLGTVWQLARLPIGPVGESAPIIYYCIGILKSFATFKYNDKDLPHSIEQSKIVASRLEGMIQNKSPQITQDVRDVLTYDLINLRTLLFSELAKLTIILLEEKRGYSVGALWKNQFNLLPKGVVTHLSKFVQSNLTESAKCLVLNCYTAVGFHSMRSIEHVSRKYYQLVKGKAPIKPNGKSMGLGSIAQEFIDLRKSSDDLSIIGSIIKGLCKKKRDPLAHPEIVALKEDEAIDTFIDALQVISKVVEDAKAREPHFITPWKRGYLF